MRFLREDEASKTMSLFEEAAESKRISKSALKNWVVRIWEHIAFNMCTFAISILFFSLFIVIGSRCQVIS